MIDVVLETLVRVSTIFIEHFLVGNETVEHRRDSHGQNVHEDI